MQTIGRLFGTKRNLDTGNLLVCFEVRSEQGIQDLNKYELLDISAEKHKEKRSINANSYMWELIGKIAQCTNSTNVDIYRQCLREVGVTNMLAVKKEAVAEAIRLLTDIKASGTGDFAEIQMGGEAPDGYITVVQYVGSSRYNTQEMSRLIDYVIEMADMLHIDTLPPAEIKKLKESSNA